MTQKSNIFRPRAALLIGAALIATPAFAQDQSVTPPPIMTTPAPAPAQAPAAPPATPARVIQVAPAAPVVQAVPSVEEQQRGSNASAAPAEAAPAPVRRSTTAATRTTTRQTTRTPAPARAAAPARTTAPAPAAAPAPLAETPAPPQQTAVTPPPAEPAAVPVAETPAQTSTETTRSTGIAWPWLAGGVLLVLAGLAALLLMARRRREDEPVAGYGERAYAVPAVEPVRDEAEIVPAPEPRGRPRYVPPVAAIPVAPVVAAPIVTPVRAPEVAPVPGPEPEPEPEIRRVAEVTEAHEEIEIARPEDADLAGVADASAPVGNRPWLEFGLRPVRAGTSDEEALVDIELTIGNSGDTAAKDVRISAFMLADEDAGEMEKLLMEHRSDTNVPPVTIAAGDGTRVDAHLAVPKGELGRTFNPVVVAEARYTLPDGSEGHTQAAFKIGRPAPSEEGVGAIGATRPHMVENLEAELLGTPEHA